MGFLNLLFYRVKAIPLEAASAVRTESSVIHAVIIAIEECPQRIFNTSSIL